VLIETDTVFKLLSIESSFNLISSIAALAVVTVVVAVISSK
jgi:hypothetical protein